MSGSVRWISSSNVFTGFGVSRPSATLAVVTLLLCLGVANILFRATTRTFDDGVFWRTTAAGVTVGAIAEGAAADAADLRIGDTVLFIGDAPVETAADVQAVLRAAAGQGSLRYTVLRPGSPAPLDLTLTPAVEGAPRLYFVLAIVGVFTLLVGGAVRLKRPDDPATLHFLWLAVAFFGVLTFSFTGRLDRLDWTFYWADVVAMLALPPLFLHFTLVFPERARRRTHSPWARRVVVAAYVPAFALGAARVVTLLWSSRDPQRAAAIVALLDRADYLYLAACVIAGLAGLLRAITQVTTITARRQLRWIAWGTALGGAPFAFFYAVPFAFDVDVSLAMQLSAVPLSIIPLAYASAIVRYRLLDIEVIVKRMAVYAAGLCAIVIIYVVLLDAVGRVLQPGGSANQWVLALLATLVAVLLAPPVKNAVQTLLDRAFYRDRYDYRRALVGFARDLNSDLDLHRLSERLVSRVVETLLVDRMALMLETDTGTHFGSVRASGFGDAHPPALLRRSSIGARLDAGHTVALDDPIAVGRFPVEEIEFWRDAGLYYFVPCVAKNGTIAVLVLGRKDSGAHLTSEDMALLGTVAGQIATALENAQLYRQLHLKAVELDRLRSFNENILESLDEGLLVLALDDQIVRWNAAIEKLYGLTRAQAVGRRFGEVFDAAFVEGVRAARRDSPGGVTLARVPLAVRGGADGDRTLTVNCSIVPLRASDAGGTITMGTIVILEDVTTRVQLEEQLQISDKMASIGLLAAGVAHEVNTPLTGISSFTQMLLEGADPEDPRTRLLEKIERQTFRAAKIVNGLLNLSRPAAGGAVERKPVDLNVVIADVLSLLEHQFEVHHVRVRRELSEAPALVLGVEHKLQQVFLNLFLNARDAMPRGGWLSVRTRVEDTRVLAEVADTGSGIPSEYLTRIYDPFFTTKGMGKGTGLGLSITYGIVREHEGTIDCESTIGQGTRFTVVLRPAPVERPMMVRQG